MKNTPINSEIVKEKIDELNLSDIGNATIREIVKIVNNVEEATGEKYIRMEMGVPGLKPSDIGTNAEIEALKRGVAADYPMLDGVKELKYETSRFIKNFMDIDVKTEGCIPTVGSMQGGYATFMINGKLDLKKDTALFIDPGFPVQKQQFQILNYKYESFDVYDYRGEKLRAKLESYLEKGNINSIIYSNPNNPTWVCLTDEELAVIGDLANKYDIIIVEDLAYFAMDFRKDLSQPGEAPFQASVAKYTDNYVLMISSSKVFSYAGQRLGMLCISDALYHRKYEELKKQYNADEYGYTIVMRALYSLSSGTCHSAQYALAAMFKAANDGEFNFVEYVSEYGEKAKIMKQMFLDNGFNIIYDTDLGQALANGFYFTIGYPEMTSGELLENLLYYGISAISLSTTGSNKEGLRACVSQIKQSQFNDLEERLKSFYKDFKDNK